MLTSQDLIVIQSSILIYKSIPHSYDEAVAELSWVLGEWPFSHFLNNTFSPKNKRCFRMTYYPFLTYLNKPQISVIHYPVLLSSGPYEFFVAHANWSRIAFLTTPEPAFYFCFLMLSVTFFCQCAASSFFYFGSANMA